MSIIACLRPDTLPVLFCDTLVSSEQGRGGIALPSIGPLPLGHTSASRWRAHGMTEKMIRFSDHLLGVWAGESASAITIIQHIRAVFRNDPLNAASLEEFILREHAQALQVCSFIFLVVEQTGTASAMHFNCEEIFVPSIGLVWIAAPEKRAHGPTSTKQM